MSRKLELGDFRARRDGIIVLCVGHNQYHVSKPGGAVWAKTYRERPGTWNIDVYQEGTVQMRAFVSNEALAEEAASAMLRGAPTGLEWYDLSAVVKDDGKVEVMA